MEDEGVELVGCREHGMKIHDGQDFRFTGHEPFLTGYVLALRTVAVSA